VSPNIQKRLENLRVKRKVNELLFMPLSVFN
jgi:hypothetical protein